MANGHTAHTYVTKVNSKCMAKAVASTEMTKVPDFAVPPVGVVVASVLVVVCDSVVTAVGVQLDAIHTDIDDFSTAITVSKLANCFLQVP